LGKNRKEQNNIIELGKIPQSVGKYRRAWENVVKRGKKSQTKESITEGAGK